MNSGGALYMGMVPEWKSRKFHKNYGTLKSLMKDVADACGGIHTLVLKKEGLSLVGEKT
jgi:hypothetical protein